MINLNHLRVFFHAAKNLNYTRAASDLFITQPAVTAQIKAFEEVWNLKLFKRKGKRVYLTDEGLAIYEQARGKSHSDSHSIQKKGLDSFA